MATGRRVARLALVWPLPATTPNSLACSRSFDPAFTERHKRNTRNGDMNEPLRTLRARFIRRKQRTTRVTGRNTIGGVGEDLAFTDRHDMGECSEIEVVRSKESAAAACQAAPERYS